ncbi:MAG: hypothetical protein WEE89_04575 [Gemmatimonadota bacterium]
MMFHPALHHLRAFASDDLQATARAEAARHLAGCQRCRDQLSWIESVRSSLQSAPVLAAPDVSWARIRNRVNLGDVVLLAAADATWQPAPVRSRAVAAALFILVLTSGVAALLTERDALKTWFNPTINDPVEAPAAVTPAAPPGAPAPLPITTQLAIAPEQGRLSVSIAGPHALLRVRVRIGDQPDLEVEATGAAGQGRFRTGPGRLTVEQPGGGDLLLTLPRAAAHVVVMIDGRTLLVKERSQVRLLVPADTNGPEFILPVRPVRPVR